MQPTRERGREGQRERESGLRDRGRQRGRALAQNALANRPQTNNPPPETQRATNRSLFDTHELEMGDGWPAGWVGGRIAWVGGYMGGWKNGFGGWGGGGSGWVAGWIYGWDERVHVWMQEWVDGWMKEWMASGSRMADKT